MNPGGQRFRRIRRRHRILGLLRLIRTPNLILIFVCQVLVSIRLLQGAWWEHPAQRQAMLLVFLATLFSAAGGYIINDYYDVKIDVLNKPRRVVVGRLVSRRKSLIAHFLLSFLAVGLAFWAGNRLGVMVLFCTGWLWLYSNRLKRLPLIGNLSVALLTSVSLYLPALVAPARNEALVLFCLFAFWTTLIREIVKDMEDIRGDLRHGCKTLPIVAGIPKTRTVLYVIGILFLGTLFLASFSLPDLWRLTVPVLAVPMYFLYRKLAVADTQSAFARISAGCKWIMLAGTLSMLFV